jgi:hypothetical protein
MTFTTNAVTQVLESLVEEKGRDYVYPPAAESIACYYSEEDGAPSCIVGHVIAKLEPELFHALYVRERKAQLGSASADEVLKYPVEFGRAEDDFDDMTSIYDNPPLDDSNPKHNRLARALSVAQSIQDGGRTWGAALEGYRRVLAGEDEWLVRREFGV